MARAGVQMTHAAALNTSKGKDKPRDQGEWSRGYLPQERVVLLAPDENASVIQNDEIHLLVGHSGEAPRRLCSLAVA